MTILIDTHVFLWAILEPHRLSNSMKQPLIDPENIVLLSTASLWEMGVKYAQGKLPLKLPPDLLILQQMQIQNIQPLSLNMKHALRGHKLPLHHRDPFDRMIIAQAQVEHLPIMTADANFRRYDVKILD